MEFTSEEKNALFDKIAAMYFNKNFGSTQKADFETLLFSEYIEHCLRFKLPFDDYTISKELGITQSRVRSLKERKELMKEKQKRINTLFNEQYFFDLTDIFKTAKNYKIKTALTITGRKAFTASVAYPFPVYTFAT